MAVETLCAEMRQIKRFFAEAVDPGFAERYRYGRQ